MTDRLEAQLAFLTEADKLKAVYRATKVLDGHRHEDSGSHSWHIALYAMILAEHAKTPVNIDRVIKMLLIHDLVEIDVGDSPIHGDHDIAAMEAAEAAAADRIFGLLPDDQRDAYRALWDEFEAAESDDAVFAKYVDNGLHLAATTLGAGSGENGDVIADYGNIFDEDGIWVVVQWIQFDDPHAK